MHLLLNTLCSPGARVDSSQGGVRRFSIPGGPAGSYRVAQLDDYRGLPRRKFRWSPPLTLSVRARAGRDTHSGTWGFGLWNAPLSMSIGFGSASLLPALPNTAWFFYASPENYLSLRDDLPASGFLAQSFESPRLPLLLLSPGAVLAPLLALRPAARLLRRWASRLIREDATRLDAIDPDAWHDYRLVWKSDRVSFLVNGIAVHETGVSPVGPLGLVVWIDNQFARFTPDGGLGFGALAAPNLSMLDVATLEIN